MSWPFRAWAFVWDRVFPGSKVYPADAAPDRDQLLVNASQPSSILKHGIKATEQLVSLRIGSQVRLRAQGSAPTAHQDSLSPEDFDDRESSRVMRTKSNFWSGVRMNPNSTRTSITGKKRDVSLNSSGQRHRRYQGGLISEQASWFTAPPCLPWPGQRMCRAVHKHAQGDQQNSKTCSLTT